MSRTLDPATPADVGLIPEGLARIDGHIQGLIDQGVLAGAVTLVARHGKLAHLNAMGLKDIASGEPLTTDTLFRIYSMTKPVTGLAMAMLHDEGLWDLDDPIARHLPEFEGVKVMTGVGPDGAPIVEDAVQPPTMRQLMTHTAGFAYGMAHSPGDADRLYRQAEVWQAEDLTGIMQRLAGVPLDYQPGSRWQYSLSMDIQGAIIERLSGQSLPDFMRTRIFEPLGMTDTAFHTPPDKRHRLATLYFGRQGEALSPMLNPLLPDHETPPGLASGGGGLVSTASDYARFAQLLLNGGEFGGRRLLSEAAVKLQMTNHLPDWMLEHRYLAGHQHIRPGFGYGFNGVVFTDPDLAGIPVGRGTYHWDGAAGTWFWADPENDLLFVGMVQLLSWASPPLQATTQTMMAQALA
ncbi:MAG: beta-lactamase [Caulobacter sp.]|nr:beta-lactamase [Caulobacter sp.]